MLVVISLKDSRIHINGIVVAAVAARASRSDLLHFYVLVAATPACRARRRLAFVAASWKEENIETYFNFGIIFFF